MAMTLAVPWLGVATEHREKPRNPKRGGMIADDILEDALQLHSRRTPKTELPIRLSASCRPAQIRDRQLVTTSAKGRRAIGNYRRGAPTRAAAGWEVLPSGRILNLSAHQASATPAACILRRAAVQTPAGHDEGENYYIGSGNVASMVSVSEDAVTSTGPTATSSLPPTAS